MKQEKKSNEAVHSLVLYLLRLRVQTNCLSNVCHPGKSSPSKKDYAIREAEISASHKQEFCLDTVLYSRVEKNRLSRPKITVPFELLGKPRKRLGSLGPSQMYVELYLTSNTGESRHLLTSRVAGLYSAHAHPLTILMHSSTFSRIYYSSPELE